MKNLYIIMCLSIFSCLLSCKNNKVNSDVNYDESMVVNYNLPALLNFKNGDKVLTSEDWKVRRDEILVDYKKYVYGNIPEYKGDVLVKQGIEKVIWDGLAILQEFTLTTNNNVDIKIVVFKPNKKDTIFPALLGLNFGGNQTISDNENITIFDGWVDAKIIEKPEFKGAVVNNRGTTASRDARGGYRWDIKQLMKNDIMFISACYNDIIEDEPSLYAKTLNDKFKTINKDETSAISIWAWGNMRIMDYLQTRDDIIKDKIVVYGHSRLGKTALWTSANDNRFAGVISNESGEGGAALLRRNYGETIEIINTQFPHWFVKEFKTFNGKANNLPIDQHMLVALSAPKPIYVASADDDKWSDPKGEYLSQYYASDVYKLLTGTKFAGDKPELIAVDTNIAGIQSYHIRTGLHMTNKFDWNNYIQFINNYVK